MIKIKYILQLEKVIFQILFLNNNTVLFKKLIMIYLYNKDNLYNHLEIINSLDIKVDNNNKIEIIIIKKKIYNNLFKIKEKIIKNLN